MYDLEIEHKINDYGLWSKLARNLFILIATILATQYFIEFIVQRFIPELRNENWYYLALSIISVDMVSFPLYYILMKRLPNSKVGKVKKIGSIKFFVALCMCFGIAFIGNIVGIIINAIFSLISGNSIINPVVDIIEKGNPILIIIYAVILAPIIEEIIFRKLLLDKIRRYGDLIAILTSGIAFGLMHMNLHQFFYATALGIMFAYITIKTNTVRYSIVIHMLINLSSTTIGLLITNEMYIIYAAILALIYLAVLTAGICLVIINYKKIKLDIADVIILDKKKIIFNSWTICYILICVLFIILNVIA